MRVWMTYAGVNGYAHPLSWVTAAVYFIRDVGMSPLDLVLTGTALELGYFLFEVPTGIVADLISRRLSVIIAMVVTGVSMLAVGLFPHTWAIWAAMALWGIGWTFRSGAEDAWLADEVGPAALGGAYQRSAQLERITGLLGIASAIALALVDLRLPFLVAGVITLCLAVFLVVAMPEDGYTRPSRAEHASALKAITTTARRGRTVVAGHPVLVLVLGIAFVTGMWAEGFDRLNEAHFLTDIGLPEIGGLDNLVWFGILEAAALLLSFLIAAPLVSRVEAMGQERLARLLLVLYTALIGCALLFALAGMLWLAIAGFLATTVARELTEAPYRTWLNNSITDSTVRSTVLSFTTVFGSAGEWGGGPVLGWIGNRWSIRTALTVGAVLLTPAIGLLARAAAHHGREPDLAEADLRAS